MDVITHDQAFHSDDVMSLSILKIAFGKISLLRVERDDPIINKIDAICVDVGRVFDGEKKFDHHQDRNLPASVKLVWDKFQDDFLNKCNFKSTQEEEYTRKKITGFLTQFDKWDTNQDNILIKWKKRNEFTELMCAPQLIEALNSNPKDPIQQYKNFDFAVELGVKLLYSLVEQSKRGFATAEEWANVERLSPEVAFATKYCSGWSEVEGNTVKYAFFPNKQGYALDTVDSEDFPVPPKEAIVALIGDNNIVYYSVHKLIVADKESALKVSTLLL